MVTPLKKEFLISNSFENIENEAFAPLLISKC